MIAVNLPDFRQKNAEPAMIRAENIIPNRFQPRRKFSDETLFSLSRSIREYGLIQPITVRSIGNGYYEIIAGERRYRACRLAGMNEIPAYIMNANKTKSAVLALIENVQREDLHFFEEAAAINKLINNHNLTQDQVSKALGKSQSTIANKLRLLKIDEETREQIVKYGLTERHARALLRLSDVERQRFVVERVHKKSLNVKRTEDLVESLIKGSSDSAESHSRLGKFVLGNRICINSLKAVYDSMCKKGIHADFKVEDNENCIIVSIIINKS